MAEALPHDPWGHPEWFEEVLQRVKAGDEAAAGQLFDLFGPVLRHHVHGRLRQAVRQKFGDTEDVVQNVWLKLWDQRLQEKNFQLPQECVAYLIHLADDVLRKLDRKYFQTGKSNVVRERPLGQVDEEEFVAGLAQSPSALATVVMEEMWQAMLQGQPELCRQILCLRRAGHTVPAIARQLKLCEKTVRRLLEELTPRFPRMN